MTHGPGELDLTVSEGIAVATLHGDAAAEAVPGPRSRPESPPTAVSSGFVVRDPDTWPLRLLAPLGYWVASRLVMLTMLFGLGDLSRGEVTDFYQRWNATLLTGSFPIHDSTWQYPPGAALALLLPNLIPFGSYLVDFVLVILLTDAAVTLALLRAGKAKGRSLAGVWAWVLGMPLLYHVPFARYDVIVTALAVFALLLLRRFPVLAGMLAGLGVGMKVWPGVAVLGAGPGRAWWRSWLAAAGTLAVLFLSLYLTFRHAFGFLTAEQGRGIQFESVGGTILLVAKKFGYSGYLKNQFGDVEFVGPYVSTISHVAVGLSVLAVAWLLLWRFRARVWTAATAADAALAAVLLSVSTSRVLSPQYLIWIIGITAVCLCYRETTQRPVAGLLVVAVGLTSVEYPFYYVQALNYSTGILIVLAIRNLLILTATVWSCARLWRGSRPKLS